MTTENIKDVESLVLGSNQKLIGTHSGVFHCDEVLALSILKYSNDFKDGLIVRSRSDAIHEKMNILVDVGSVFDPENYRFDHHQRSFEEYFDTEITKDVKMSSAGLIFKFFGREIVDNAIKAWDVEPVSDDEWPKIRRDIYRKLFLEVDAIDNGVSQLKAGTGGELIYTIGTGLGSRVSR